MNIAIIGGGAAGFFAAITVKENYPNYNVTIFEKTNKLLSKVQISGGGRCNVTNACGSIDEFVEAYPRGKRLLQKLMYRFSNKDTMHWFITRGVPLVTQPDNCVFPQSQDSESIIDCFFEHASKLKINIKLTKTIKEISKKGDKICIMFDNIKNDNLFDKVIVATGGSSKRDSYQWLVNIGHTINEPVPSLFTFKMPKSDITNLQGIVIPQAICSIQSTNLISKDALLITDWGFSGPAILKLSSYGARILSDMNYCFILRINWSGIKDQSQIKSFLLNIKNENSSKNLINFRPYDFPTRFWSYLINRANVNPNKKWAEISQQELNKIINVISNDVYKITGRNKFKEEFVTCGGVSLNNINPNTLESKVFKNMYFAGEVLDIDGITGGFNLQAAWTTGYIAGLLK